MDVMTELINTDETLSLASEIVAAYVSNNEMAAEELPAFITRIYGHLCAMRGGRSVSLNRPEAAVSVEDSVQEDFIVCLEDGKQLKMLKRHLKTAFNLTPDQYRERWNLPADYPMVAPNYAKQRSRLAKSIGLGTQRRREAA